MLENFSGKLLENFELVGHSLLIYSSFFADKISMMNRIFSELKTRILFLLITTVSYASFADSSYSVQKGDTLFSISRKYQITVPELRAANNLSEKDVLKAGQKLIIPSADITNAAALSSTNKIKPSEDTVKKSNSKSSSIYEVQKGDTLYGISRKFSMKLPELLSMNGLDSSSTIKVGQKLKVLNEKSEKKSEIKHTETKIIEKTDKASNAYKSSGIIWPLSNPTVQNIKGKVSGVELTGKDGEAVKVVHEGTVMYTGLYRGFGEIVFVQTKTGLIYSYSGLSEVKVKKGDYVLSGDVLGNLGNKTETTIKFMVFQNGNSVDPVKAPRN